MPRTKGSLPIIGSFKTVWLTLIAILPDEGCAKLLVVDRFQYS
jgi:hypothetical protein